MQVLGFEGAPHELEPSPQDLQTAHEEQQGIDTLTSATRKRSADADTAPAFVHADPDDVYELQTLAAEYVACCGFGCVFVVS